VIVITYLYLQRSDFFFWADFTNWNSWRARIYQSTFYMHWDSCSTGGWAASFRKPFMVL